MSEQLQTLAPTTAKTAENAVFLPKKTQTATTQQIQEPVISTSDTLMQVTSALGGIIILIIALMWLIKKSGFSGKSLKNNATLQIKASCSLGSKEKIVIVEVKDEWLVLGVTAQNINLLHRCEPETTEIESTDKVSLFQSLLKKKQAQSSVSSSDKPSN